MMTLKSAAPARVVIDYATLVSFSVGRDVLAAPVESVVRVLRWTEPSPLPQSPNWLEGVIPHGGRMVPVVDLCRRFGSTDLEVSASTRIIVFTVGGSWLGAVVDAVLEVITVDATTISAPPPVVGGLSGQLLIGLAHCNERAVPVLDVARLLSATEQLQLVQQHAAGRQHDARDVHASSEVVAA